METALRIAVQLLGVVILAAFAGAWVSSYRLTRRDEEIERERQEPSGFRVWPTKWPSVTEKDYPEDLRRLWIIRDRCMKTCAICVGLIALVAVIAAIVDVPFILE